MDGFWERWNRHGDVVEYPEDEMDADGGCFGMFWDVSTWNVFLWPSLGFWFKVTDCSI